MNCLRCTTPNEEGAKFCKNCGMKMTYKTSNENTTSKTSDTLLIIFLSVAFVTAIAQFAIQKLVVNWYEGPTKYVQGFLWLIQNLSFILIPLSIKNKIMKIVGLVITVIMVSYWVFTNLEFMLK